MPSQYTPQPQGWQLDLYKFPDKRKKVISSHERLRFANDDYCEISRLPGGFGDSRYLFFLLMGLILLGCAVSLDYMFVQFVYDCWLYPKKYSLLMIIGLTIMILILNIAVYMLSVVNSYNYTAPRDFPARFNRKTGKVTICEHPILQLSMTHIFKHAPWNVGKCSFKEYDWANVQAILVGGMVSRGSYGVSAISQISCVALKPGSNEVVDIFYLTNRPSGEEIWQWIVNYMSKEEEWLDMDEYDTGSEIASEAKWPEDLDKKSKASSIEEYEQIAAQYNKNEGKL